MLKFVRDHFENAQAASGHFEQVTHEGNLKLFNKVMRRKSFLSLQLVSYLFLLYKIMDEGDDKEKGD